MPSNKNDKQLLVKIERYCAFQERCRLEVKIKLRQLGASDSEIDSTVSRLEKGGFVNESRYARAFARDKFHLHGWGKIKIGFALNEKSIPQKLIDEALEEIEADEYQAELKSLLKKKEKELSEIDNAYIRKDKLANYLIGRGFEPEMVWEFINEK